MMEEELRQAFEAETAHIGPGRDRLRAAQFAAARRRQRRNGLLVALVSGAVSIGAVLGLSSSPVQFAGQDETTADSSSPAVLAARTEAAGPEPVEASVSSERPNILVGASVAGRLVVIDSVSGQTTKVLLTAPGGAQPGTGRLLGGVALSGDARGVYFDQYTSSECDSEIRYVSTSGGDVTRVTAGRAPALSPDGRQLAFVRLEDCRPTQIVVRDVASGQERVVVSGGSAPSAVATLSWSPGGTRLLVDVRFDDPARDRLSIFDQAEQSSFDGGASLNASSSGAKFEWPSYLPDGQVFVSERCCVVDGETSDETSRMLVVDPSTRAETLIAYGITTKSHTATASDLAGTHLLYMSGQDLMVSDDGRRPVPLAYGLLGAAWR